MFSKQRGKVAIVNIKSPSERMFSKQKGKVASRYAYMKSQMLIKVFKTDVNNLFQKRDIIRQVI